MNKEFHIFLLQKKGKIPYSRSDIVRSVIWLLLTILIIIITFYNAQETETTKLAFLSSPLYIFDALLTWLNANFTVRLMQSWER